MYGSIDMVTRMKTTVEIADALLDEIRQVAVREGTTLRAILESALRAELERRRTENRYVLPDLSVGDPNLTVLVDGAAIRHAIELSYEGRGA